MRELNVNEVNEVSGGDAADVAEGALLGGGIGAGLVGAAAAASNIALAAAAMTPVGAAVIVGGAILGAIFLQD